ncbi:hypothetical protein ACR9MM_01310 [Helicobacter pylori]
MREKSNALGTLKLCKIPNHRDTKKAKLSPNINLKKPMSLAFGCFTILEKAKNLF